MLFPCSGLREQKKVKKTKNEADLDKHIRMKTATFAPKIKLTDHEEMCIRTVGHPDGERL